MKSEKNRKKRCIRVHFDCAIDRNIFSVCFLQQMCAFLPSKIVVFSPRFPPLCRAKHGKEKVTRTEGTFVSNVRVARWEKFRKITLLGEKYLEYFFQLPPRKFELKTSFRESKYSSFREKRSPSGSFSFLLARVTKLFKYSSFTSRSKKRVRTNVLYE